MIFEVDTDSFYEFAQQKLRRLLEIFSNLNLDEKHPPFEEIDEFYINLKQSMDCAIYNYYLCHILHKKFERLVGDVGFGEATKTNIDLMFEFEFYSYVMNIRGSLDTLAKIISNEYKGKSEKTYGFTNLIEDLKCTKNFGELDNFLQYILQESKVWVFPLQDDELKECKEWIGFPKENKKKEVDPKKIRYTRTDEEYGVVMDMITFPKLNEFRRLIAHGKKIQTFHTITKNMDSDSQSHKWCHTIPNKPILKKGQKYSSIPTLEYIDELLERTIELQINALKQVGNYT